MSSSRQSRPLVYSCSGCSDVAQLANEVAVRLDHSGQVEMSCIAGVGGGVPGLVRTARSGRPIVAIDGCQMHCVQHCLDNVGVDMTEHVKLYEMGYRKRRGQRYSEEAITQVCDDVSRIIARLPLQAEALTEGDS
jgi:uncharacterized metal-binding protein